MKKMKKASEVIIIILLGFVLWGEFVGALSIRRNLVNDNFAGPDKNLPNEISSNDDNGKQDEKDVVGAENENEEQDKDSETDFEVEIINTEKQPDSEGEPDGIDNGTCVCVEKNGKNEDGEQDEEQQEETPGQEEPDDGGEGNPEQETVSRETSDDNDGAQNPVEDSENPTGVKETVLGDSEEESNNEGKKEMDKDEDQGQIVGITVPQQGFTFSPLDSKN
ncbi:acidic leucine-rich nuclear phosphoprotein 32 family member B-like [Episyrphus balteatus]|uniref:acidic leucine-rich nuclear phosphoprotein 32 family member B-like n=1 Tax=Episyrphus balteatus TaxID=286459 RepID=UPI002485D980|nr:acidic leucine-rich nuclear phosphoprotein 32 family member B-like [Episyrphus balteatus]